MKGFKPQVWMFIVLGVVAILIITFWSFFANGSPRVVVNPTTESGVEAVQSDDGTVTEVPVRIPTGTLMCVLGADIDAFPDGAYFYSNAAGTNLTCCAQRSLFIGDNGINYATTTTTEPIFTLVWEGPKNADVCELP